MPNRKQRKRQNMQHGQGGTVNHKMEENKNPDNDPIDEIPDTKMTKTPPLAEEGANQMLVLT